MSDVNWWLMVLAFALGLLLTFAFMIRRVTREVPVYGPLGRGPGVDVGTRDPGTGDIEIADTAPFGAGSVRLAEASRTGPPGHTIKGNEDSMLYHTTDSPSYEQTIAEVWFVDEETAVKAGFGRWDKNQTK
ncbi:hypothetical protein MCHIJ_22770 [Mycolicibacterium chitae]|uniref:Conserved exported or membrane protein of uncharacterized function n=1 Tax=Mycolicibacterium chitae TaxID=1792 RepID=A0A448I010_MYCCI|nr:hypothetical protein [Mycolicibacterium chitae]MCV7108700.1 hypothetical protein [Mycolicibacterium chitae]BBZ02840.1 hypothetical protein MCHIJ_22770 [Mycolicibacterium chitae]VEG45790.1 Conserved exported or membrane protein of uncharacterised function [Mycolicibacterium chitae]